MLIQNPYAESVLKGDVVGVRYEPYANFGLACSAFKLGTVARVLAIKQRNLANKRFSAMGEISLIPSLIDWSNIPRELASHLEDVTWLEKTFAGKGFLRFPIRKNAEVPTYMTSSGNKNLPTNRKEAVLLGKGFPKLIQVWMCILLCRYETPRFQLLSWPKSSDANGLQRSIVPFHLTTSMNISGEPSIRESAKATEFCSREKISLLDWGYEGTEHVPPKGYFVINLSSRGWEVIRSIEYPEKERREFLELVGNLP